MLRLCLSLIFHSIEDTMDTIRAQNYGGPAKIVVEDSASTDGSLDAASGFELWPRSIPATDFLRKRKRYALALVTLE